MMLKLNAKKVADLVYKIAECNGIEVIKAYCSGDNEEYPDSFSMYFVLKYKLVVKKIRISNHTRQHKYSKVQRLLKSITVNKKTSLKDIEKFILNRIDDVKRGSLYETLNYISQSA